MSSQQINLMEFLDAIKIGICRTTVGTDAQFVFVNTALADMLAYKKADLEGADVADAFQEVRAFKYVMGRIRNPDTLERLEVVLRKKTGEAIWCSLAITVEQDAQGNPLFLDFVVEDISQLKAVENDLVRSKGIFKIVFDNSAAAITVTDQEERIVTWNPFAEQMLDMTKAELFNKPIQELYPEREWRKMRKLKIREKGSLSGIMTQVIKKDGTILDVDASISILKDTNEKIVGSIGILRDITKQKRIQEMMVQAKMAAEEANSSKSIFLAKMSHELRTPMNAVIGMIDLTLDTPLNDEQRDNLKVAKEAAGNLLGLLNDILDLSKAEAGKITIESIEISLREVVRSVCKGLAVLAANRGIELKYSIASDIPELLMADPVRIRQIIINLVNNAIKFTHKGSVEVIVKVNSREEKDCEIFFSVKDTGIGIPKDKQGSLFEMFTQVDEKTSRRYGGTGLGLAICKKLVEMMNGRIWVESEEGQGSAFNFALRFPISTSTTTANVTAASGEGGAAAVADGLGRIRILLAEDNLVNQKIAVRILEKRGWEVIPANNGREALDILAKSHFDVVLMDDQMPEMSGVEATAVIRNEEKQTGLHLPIIAMTANAMSGDREKYLSMGMDDYVSKPIDRELLFQAIINHVQKRKES